MKMTRKILLIVAIFCSSTSTVLSQVDSTFSVVRNGVEAKFSFTKFAKPEQLRTVANTTFPLYSFNKAQYTRIKGLLINFAHLENDYQLRIANQHEKDSIAGLKENALVENAKLEQERAKNFQASYNSLLSVNTQLNDQVKKAEHLAVSEHRKRKLNSILLGALAFSAGVVIGIAVR